MKNLKLALLASVALGALAFAPVAMADPPSSYVPPNTGSVSANSYGGSDIKGGGGTSINGTGYATQNITATVNQASGAFGKITGGCGCNPMAESGQWSTNTNAVNSTSNVSGLGYGSTGSASGGYDTHGWNSGDGHANLTFYAQQQQGNNGNGNNGNWNGHHDD